MGGRTCRKWQDAIHAAGNVMSLFLLEIRVAATAWRGMILRKMKTTEVNLRAGSVRSEQLVNLGVPRRERHTFNGSPGHEQRTNRLQRASGGPVRVHAGTNGKGERGSAISVARVYRRAALDEQLHRFVLGALSKGEGADCRRGKGLTTDREGALCYPRDGPNISYRPSYWNG